MRVDNTADNIDITQLQAANHQVKVKVGGAGMHSTKRPSI